MQSFKIVFLDDGKTRMTCREANCRHYLNGWLTIVDETSELGRKQAHYIRRESGRGFVEFRSEEAGEHLGERGKSIAPGLTVFKFHAGQACFGEHADREVLFVHQQGERRRLHGPRDWNEHFNEAAEEAAEAAGRG